MRYLVDTNVLTRMAEPGHAMYPTALGATVQLGQDGHELYLVPQVFYEFWVVSTRPVAVNGLGLQPAAAASELTRLRSLFLWLDDTPAIYPVWERLVSSRGVMGKKAHDARLVAAMVVHGLTDLLTFNDQEFRVYGEIDAWTPARILGRS